MDQQYRRFPEMRSWLASACGDTEFPVQNLPYGVFDAGTGPRLGVAIGDYILDVAAVEHGLNPALLATPTWNRFMAAGPSVWAALRTRVTDLLTDPMHCDHVTAHLVPQASVRQLMPFDVSEYTDFFASMHHARNVGSIFRGTSALPDNWLSIPIGYNGRASSVVVSGTEVRRPMGQIRPIGQSAPIFAPSERFDIELELGAVVGLPSEGHVGVEEARRMIFGYVLLNDWSARDIQAWEYQPLGPFQAKATATTVSPWIVPAAALEPFLVQPPARIKPMLPHLDEEGPTVFDIALSVSLATASAETVIASTNTREIYYSAAQQLSHHTTAGCPMRVGDLLGSGTISGPEKDNWGSLLELSWGGRDLIPLVDGSARTFLEDGDTVTLRGAAYGNGFRIGFGACSGTITPSS